MRPIGSNPPPTGPRPAPTQNPPPAGHTPRAPLYNAIDRLIGLMLEVVPAMRRTGMAVTLCADVEAAAEAARVELCSGSEEAGERATPARKTIDGCTESNCQRCNTHPDHRGDLKHAGLSSADADGGMFARMTDAQIANAVRGVEQNYLRLGLDPKEQAISLVALRDAGRDIGAETLDSVRLFRAGLRAGMKVKQASDAGKGPPLYPEAAAVCAEAYQVVGSLLSDLGQFDTERGTKILDNLSNHRLVHTDVLPWPRFAAPATMQDRLTDLSMLAGSWIVEAAGPAADARNECAMQLLEAIEKMGAPTVKAEQAGVDAYDDALDQLWKLTGNDHRVYKLFLGFRDSFATRVAAEPAAAARNAAPIASAPRDGTVIRLLWGSDGIDGDSPGWWSAPLSPVAGADGLFPSTGDMAWSFIDLSGDRAFVNKAVDSEYGPTHWLPYVAPAAGAKAVAHIVDGRVEKGLMFNRAAADTMALAGDGIVREVVFGDDASATGATSIARAFDRAVLEPMRQQQNAGRAKGGSEATGELRIWGVQKPGSMPKLCGAREIAELNWYPNEGYDLICLQVVERVPARVEIDSIRAQAQSSAPEVKA